MASGAAPTALVPDDPQSLLGLALDTAREAGELLVRGRRGEIRATATKSSPTDVVTAMDTAAEELIRTRLLAARPNDGMLGEEGSSRIGSSPVRWVVDPIDGTVNYLYDLAQWAVSIGVEVEGRVVAGVVHAPALGRTYTAIAGAGAFRDGRRLACSSVTELSQSLVATGFGYAARRRARQAEVLLRVLPRVRDIRRFGAASLDLCATAEGVIDAYYERGLNPWDMAAGGLVAAEAGVRVGGLAGPASGELLVAAPPQIFDALIELLGQEPAADRD